MLKRKMKGGMGRLPGGGILNGSGVGAGGGGGYFRLDGKEGLLNGMGVGSGAGATEKAD